MLQLLFLSFFNSCRGFFPCHLLSADCKIQRAASLFIFAFILKLQFLRDQTLEDRLEFQDLLIIVLMWIFYDLFCHNFFFVRRYFHHLSFQEFRSAFCGAWCCPGKFRDQLADCAELESTLLQFFYIHKKLNIISGVIAMTHFKLLIMGLIKKPNELTVKNALSALIYGQPGMGKTTLALSSPQPLLLDFDGGVHRVNAAHRVDTVQISKWEEVDEVLTSGEIAEYKTIVIDTAGKMLSFMDKYIMKNNPKMKKADGTLSLQGYGVRKNMFINFVNQVTLMGKSVIFVAHEREEKNGEDKQIRPEIGGSSAGDLIKELDLVGYMEAIGKDRTISFDPCEKFYGKNTCNLPARIKIPVIINAEGTITGPNDFMTKIVNTYQTYQEKQAELSSEYEGLMEVIKEQIAMVADADTANEVKQSLESLQHIFDSKLQAGMLLNKRCKELGLKFDKVKKIYEAA